MWMAGRLNYIAKFNISSNDVPWLLEYRQLIVHQLTDIILLHHPARRELTEGSGGKVLISETAGVLTWWHGEGGRTRRHE